MKALRAVALDVSLLRRRRDLRLLTFGYAVSLAGGEFTIVALAVQVYALTHSTVAVGLLGSRSSCRSCCWRWSAARWPTRSTAGG